VKHDTYIYRQQWQQELGGTKKLDKRLSRRSMGLIATLAYQIVSGGKLLWQTDVFVAIFYYC